MFERYGKVQTCIINKEKRHAFVKMVSRADAVAAKDGMERDRHPDSQLRVSHDHLQCLKPQLISIRHVGAWDLDLVNAVTTQLVSASFPSANSLMLTENGC